MPPRRSAKAASLEPAAAPAAPIVSPYASHPLLAPLPGIFASTQHSLATHRKSLNALHAIFLKSVAVTTPSPDGESIRLTGEKAFGDAMRDMVTRVLGVKKGVVEGDRSVKFLASFVAFSYEKARAAANKDRDDDEDDDDDELDSPSSRLVSQLLAFLLRGFTAKNKVVRFRAVQLVALLVNSLGEIDDDTFQLLKKALLDRVRDKESSVRMQAVVALAKLQGAEEDSSEDEDEEEVETTEDEKDEDDSDEEDEYVEPAPKAKGGKKAAEAAKEKEEKVINVLIDVLTHDPAAEVRRASLLNLLPSPVTLPSLIQRTLDLDPINRRAAFAHVLSDIPFSRLSRPQRELIVLRGTGDREDSVRKACGAVIAKWCEEVGGVEELLGCFELGAGEEEGKVAERVLGAMFEQREDLMDAMAFDDDFYNNLTPSTSFLARSYFHHLRATASPKLEDVQPVSTKLAFLIQREWTALLVLLEAEEHNERACLEREEVVRNLVGMARDGDEGDEMGRRAMFELMRALLSHALLPTSLITQCLDVLSKGNGITERSLVGIVVEIIQVLRADSALLTSESEGEIDEDDEEAVEARERGRRKRASSVSRANGGSARKRGESRGPMHVERRKELDLRCLAVCRGLLERVVGNVMTENSMMNGLVVDLIVPAVRSKDYDVRADGLLCLGLGCLVDRSMALDSFELFARQSQATDGALQIKILQTLFDILVLHGINFGVSRNFGPDVILGFLLNCLEQEEAEVAGTAVVGIAKLLLAGHVTDEEILSRMVLLYFASETADNPELRQCLSFFFPAYCYSNSANQRRVADVLLPALTLLKGVYDELSDKTVMVAPLQIGLQLLDWTDPQKAIETPHTKPDEKIHFEVAVQMVKLLYTLEEKDERKLLCQLLPKLYIPEEIDSLQVKSLMMLISSLKLNRPLVDATSRNALVRFETALNKTFGDRLNSLTDEELKEAVELKAVQNFLKGQLQEGEEDEEDEGEEEADDTQEGTPPPHAVDEAGDDDAELEASEEEE